MINPVPPAARAERYAAFLSVGKLLIPKLVVCPGRKTLFFIFTPPISMGVSTLDISFGSYFSASLTSMVLVSNSKESVTQELMTRQPITQKRVLELMHGN